MIGFLGGFLVPKTVNDGIEGPVSTAIIINLLLIALFGIHHSIAARPWFKSWFTKFVPIHLERSFYVLVSNILVILILWQWRPITAVVWEVESSIGQYILYALFAIGWVTIVLSSFLIDHFDLFGVRQVYFHLTGKQYTHVPFKDNFLYKISRNPIMVGWFIAFWATPYMTVGHLVFALGLTAYGFIGILCEEQTHRFFLGEEYERYHAKTPMILPIPGMKRGSGCPFHAGPTATK